MARNECVSEAVKVAPNMSSWLACQEILVLIEGGYTHPGKRHLIDAYKHLPAHKRLLLLYKHSNRKVGIKESRDVGAVFGIFKVFGACIRANSSNVRIRYRIVSFIFFK